MPRGASAVAARLGPPGRRRKKICGAPEPPGNIGIDHRRRAKPPSPSPSITRRRTPAVLAAGVPLCGGTFTLHCPFRTAPPWPGGTEAGVRGFRHVGVVSVAFARVRGRVRGPVLRDGTRPLIFVYLTPQKQTGTSCHCGPSGVGPSRCKKAQFGL